MTDESRSKKMGESMSGIKQLFQTRHYIQCASLCQRLLTRSGEEQILPIHRAYLNFYLALSHDSLAREASMRNRDVELELAETHYLDAIADLTTPAMPQPDEEDSEDASSPTSSSSESDSSIMLRRRPSDTASLRSDHSTSTAATSVNDEEYYLPASVYKHRPKRSVTFADAPTIGTHPTQSVSMSTNSTKPTRPTLAPIYTTRPITPASALSQHEQKLSREVASFVNMVKSHLAGVRELKATHSSSRNSPSNSRPVSRNSVHGDVDMEKIRWQRKTLVFRARFDPSGTQKLCAEALAEL